MISIKTKTIAQFVAGLFGGTILGITSFLTMMNFGANYGCWKLLDNIFGTAGYESCGSFGSIAGVLTGTLIGVLSVQYLKSLNYSQVITWLAIGSFVLPFLYGVITFFPQFKNGDILATLLLISIPIFSFMVVSVLVYLFFTWIVNRVGASK